MYLSGAILSHVVAHDRAAPIDTKDVQVHKIVHFVFTVMFVPLPCENCSVGETTWDGYYHTLRLVYFPLKHFV